MSVFDEVFSGTASEERIYRIGKEMNIVSFGTCALKCGTTGSPFFVNTGRFSTGEAQGLLGELIASYLVKSGIEFDLVYGIPYKAISLASMTASKYFDKTGKNVYYAYHRKEVKDHGEEGDLVLAFDKINPGAKAVMIDDMFTTGTSLIDGLGKIAGLGINVEHVIVIFNRYKIED